MEGQNVAVERYEIDMIEEDIRELKTNIDDIKDYHIGELLKNEILTLKTEIVEIREALSIYMIGCDSMQRTQENILATLEMIINKVKNQA